MCSLDYFLGAHHHYRRIASSTVLAVLSFVTSSTSVGCSTGRSAGLAPLRILSNHDRSAPVRFNPGQGRRTSNPRSQQNLSECKSPARSFSGASSQNLRPPTLGPGQKKASRLRRRSLTLTMGGLEYRGVAQQGLHNDHSGSGASCGIHCYASRIADRRMILVGYRLADLLMWVVGNRKT
jgi:hypothetical protein